ncbi:hypothetical protein JI739_17120 [Ramlibacter sp. AW1]|uniref:DUF2486 family protein n=1 Tax=Ramlibacter aurantiacus TaxID=2801330 RepID=A0A937D8H3_9BURK|nr:hypothetical protein [Ramlibacter aurantiacus]MBL0422076.1 hypothetical protein [Ramlibacter aurantiacus]
MSARVPPRNVPTLTEVVQRPPHASSEPAGAREERLVQRILQRLEVDLDQRLREVIASLVVEQTRTLGPLVREELEASVRAAVLEALSQERDQP